MGAPPPSTVRSDFLDPLLDTVGAMANGGTSPRVVLLTGAPGVGKSTTLGGLIRLLSERGVRAHRVAADEMSRSQPYGLVSSLLGLESFYPPRADTTDLALEAVEALCADGPVALCADDVHHADADSLALLGRLAGATRDLPLSLLMARRALPVREALTALAARPDVHAVEVAGLDAKGLEHLVRMRFAARPGLELRALLAVTGGNPFHAGMMLDDLDRHGRLAVVDDVVTVSGGTGDVPESVQAGVRAHLALLDPAVRDLLQVLAVWGRPASVEQLAAILTVPPVSLLGRVQSVVASRVARWTADGALAFQHELYRDVVYADLAPSLRRVLHAACAAQLRATGGISTQILEHTSSAADRTEPAQALHIAATELAHAPAQAADLLATAAELAGDGPQADAIALARAGALAAAGQMAEAERVARNGLRSVGDPSVRYDLTRVMLHAMISGAHGEAALATIDETLSHGVDAAQRTPLTHLRRWVVVLDGRAPVDTTVPPGAAGTRSGAALVPAAMDLFLNARCETALALAVEARDMRDTAGSPVWSDGATAPIWPAWFTLYTRGPEAARTVSIDARRSAQQRGRGWLVPQQLLGAATIDQFAGRWDDAIAEFEAALEAATATGSGYLSRTVGGLLQIRVRRGELDAATTAQARWKARGLPEQFGLPMTGLTEMLLAEAQGRPGDVTEAVRRSWTTALDGGRLLWGLLAGPELAAQDGDLLARVAGDTAAVPTDEATALAPAADLVRAITESDPDRAMAAGTASRNRGHVTGELGGWEEAAVAAATRGDHALARTCAARCTELATVLGASGVHRRLTARLRAQDVRIGVSGARKRPATGWRSLTPIELQVAELVGQGLTSPQIATRLYLSPRTVQTHISHSLRKLNLRSRVELATTVTRNRA
jgi:DNA-binding CsgD family transcriptional regulator